MKSNEEKYKDAYRDYLADDSVSNWQRWDKLRQVMVAMGKTSDQIIALMDEVEAKPEPTPETFAKIFPAASIFQNHESEVVALNIMTILRRTGNKFRDLSWEEYTKERKKDGNFTVREEKYFKKVVESCVSEEKARKFCQGWREA